MKTCPACSVRWPSNLDFCPRDGNRLEGEDEPYDLLEVYPPREHAAPTVGAYNIGDKLRGYELVELLGEGSMGMVWRARHEHLGLFAAIKTLHPELCTNAGVVRRFFREAQVVNSLNHPNIIKISDFVDQQDKPPYLVMELLEGGSLGSMLTPGIPFPLHETLEIARQICSALAAVHERGIVHRDLKPDNIFIHRTRGTIYAKLLDFGLAKFQMDTDALLRTRTGTIVGTPTYISPEQIRGEKVDHRSDIYSMGCILYAVLCGHPPFVDEEIGKLLKNQLHTTPPPPSEEVEESLRGRIPPDLERVTLGCLAKKSKDRVQSMEELLEVVQSIRGEGGAPLTKRIGRQRPRARRSPVVPLVIGLAAIAVCGIALLILSFRGGGNRGARTGPSPQTSPMRSYSDVGAMPGATDTVTVRVVTHPPGASLVNAHTGRVLWRTPARVTVDRKGSIRLQVELTGYQNRVITLSGSNPSPVELQLRKLTASQSNALPMRGSPRPMQSGSGDDIDPFHEPSKDSSPTDDTINPFRR